MYQSRDIERICRTVVNTIDDDLSRVGILFRIFSRVKSQESINSKIHKKGESYYDGHDKLIRDIIGIRVILYFSDDLPIVYDRLKEFFELIEETVDKNEETKFAPTRVNLVIRLPQELAKEFNEIIQNPTLDSTFEIQLRTILSEGWHEVDHDLRYKCQEDWEKNLDLARNFNGILASLETSEYSILRLFEQLSYRHYKSKDFVAMLRTKFRIRFISMNISEDLKKLLNDRVVRDIFKLNRVDVLNFFIGTTILIPLTMDNLIFLINYKYINDIDILNLTPKEFIDEVEQSIDLLDSERQNNKNQLLSTNA
jgi:putative GTP pyrophosphokinase